MSIHHHGRPAPSNARFAAICGALVAVLGSATAASAVDVASNLTAAMPHAPFCATYQALAGAFGVVLIVLGITLPSRIEARARPSTLIRRLAQ